MAFSRFTSSKMYLRNNTELELRFDFDLKGFTGHNRKTFDDCQSLLYFLQNNPGKSIFITTTQHEDFYVDGDKLVINLKSYQEFCKIIGQNGKNRTQAFLAQKIKHYSENEKREIIASSTGEEIIERTRDFTDDQKTKLIKTNVTEVNVLETIKTLSVESQNKILEFLRSQQGGNVSGKIIETTEEVLS